MVNKNLTRRDILRIFGIGLLGLKATGSTSAFALVADDPREAQYELVKGASVMMGNVSVGITAVTRDRGNAKEAIGKAFDEMKRLEQLLNFYDQGSELSQINVAAGRNPVQVSREVIEVISHAMRVTRITKGAFNLAMGPPSNLWSFLKRKHVPSARERESLHSLTNPKHIIVDEENRTVFLSKPDMRIDAGGIGKGFIAEKAKQLLVEQGVSSGIISAAGDILLFGQKPNGRSWRVGVRHPRKPEEQIASLDLTDTVVSTSGDYERFFTKNGVMYHHLLDPKTLLPARDCQSVTVIGAHGALTDAMATGVFVMGPEDGLALLESSQHGEGLIVDGDGHISISPTLESRVALL